ncbi:transglycosylase SLT domain-containing protein [Bradyrhizobium diversitatis]|uniref:Transglycosylase SLT domain-containing protein n=1 Tax=Bradyrhizobium diversitatis TaxID=2755406 RepID=A0ABS0P970_9BRAD|nr:transglycosylase SLT domain-containing protein [Bradyrhizobium diversitatis]MBH5389595.1 transglycosylase SLT domain-containing protein [Bradyrhizobium diversitatis]
MPTKSKSLLSRLRSVRRSARWVRRRFARAPRTVRIGGSVAVILVTLALLNIAYQLIRKPTELFVLIGNALDKEPAETWASYGPLFRNASTATITPELLAALAQVESSGNPVARTYWRWRWSFNPLAIYRPASSAVGLFQMTDPAFAEAARFCVRGNAVTQTGCGFTSFYIRAVPSHAIELASVYLDRQMALVLSLAGDIKANATQKQDLAAFIHLCGAGPATAYARRKFQMLAGERCGDHLVAAYLARVNAMKRQFLRLAAEDSG